MAETINNKIIQRRIAATTARLKAEMEEQQRIKQRVDAFNLLYCIDQGIIQAESRRGCE